MEKEYIEKVLNKIKDLRNSSNMKQAEIAAKAGFTTSYYGMIERGSRTLSLEYLYKIANAFDCDVVDLLMMCEND